MRGAGQDITHHKPPPPPPTQNKNRAETTDILRSGKEGINQKKEMKDHRSEKIISESGGSARGKEDRKKKASAKKEGKGRTE